MKIEYDPLVDAAYIQFAEIGAGDVARTVPVDPREISGQIHLDFGHDGKLLGIEVLDASRFLPDHLLVDPDRG